MKVYELIEALLKAPAGADVGVCMMNTLNSDVESVDTDSNDTYVFIHAGDAQVIDDNGDDMGLLSELGSVVEEE
jgi:hypothetical protein